jgi:hypothetical protein
MYLCQPTGSRFRVLVGLAAALVCAPAFGQPPASGVYTYRYGYHPGYYGSQSRPTDPGAKPGQAVPSWNNLYRYTPTITPPVQSKYRNSEGKN